MISRCPSLRLCWCYQGRLTRIVVFQDYGEKVAKVRQAQKSFADDKERGFEAKVRSFLSLSCSIQRHR